MPGFHLAPTVKLVAERANEEAVYSRMMVFRDRLHIWNEDAPPKVAWVVAVAGVRKESEAIQLGGDVILSDVAGIEVDDEAGERFDIH